MTPLLSFLLAEDAPASAGSAATAGLRETAKKAGLGEAPKSVEEITGTVISAVLGLVGFIFMALIIYGGISWMLAGGDQTKVDKAKKIITSSVIGLVIVVAAYAIVNFVLEAITGATVAEG